MSADDKLKMLASRGLEQPRDEARERAVLAAMDAFDAAEAPVEEKIAAPTQGNPGRGRLTSIATQAWRQLMTTKSLAGPVIATLLVVPLGGYLTWQMMDTAPLKTVTFDGGAAKPAPAEAEFKADARRKVEEQAANQVAARQETTAPAADALGKLQSGQPAVAAPGRTTGLAAPANRMAQQEMAVGGAQPSIAPAPEPMPMPEAMNRDRVQSFDSNPVKTVAEQPVSTFSFDVDTASYAFTRSQLNQGVLPAPDTVRVEEFVNYFPYDWPRAGSAEQPFKPTVTVVPSPWNAHKKLMQIAIKGYDVSPDKRPAANLVFLVDTSGSMQDPDKLPLLKASFRLLLDKLDAGDTVSIVTYAGSAGVALEPTKASDKAKIFAVLDNLGAGGSTAGAAGINEAYRLAEAHYVKDGVNRVMLATDGDFNVGQSSDEELKTLIEAKREKGIFLSVFGFGQGNYNDQMMQTLAQNGNGAAAYIDTLGEAEKTLVQEATSTLFPIAKDVKVQVEFNPSLVGEYRLVGYETRALNREDFKNDRKDAGDIGSGTSVTAIYEITPKGSPAQQIDDLRYGEKSDAAAGNAAGEGEYAFLKIRYKQPHSDTSQLISTPVTVANELPSLDRASTDLRFSVAVAGFAQKLRQEDATASTGWDAIATLASGARGDDPYGYRAEFLRLVQLAKGLSAK